ncbi:hypothetical protein [Nodosilinea sp. LEGE 07298]|uniref:hypothetical protein n=1 Tax=Nodosilinea sp. LEGE 07298 TaxID=2777970 RepID=UPI001D147942|nr:hypothetical protein [Nodosilinea sp. LEGE 07298]
MKIQYLATFMAAAALTVGAVSLPTVNSVSAAPCAGAAGVANPCASANPCAGADVVRASEPPHPQVYIKSASNLAIRGADPVAYFTEGVAVLGNVAYSFT